MLYVSADCQSYVNKYISWTGLFSYVFALFTMNSSYDSDLILQTINKEFPTLGKITYLDHAGASLFAKSQLEGIHRELSENLLCNPHTNFGNSEVRSFTYVN